MIKDSAPFCIKKKNHWQIWSVFGLCITLQNWIILRIAHHSKTMMSQIHAVVLRNLEASKGSDWSITNIYLEKEKKKKKKTQILRGFRNPFKIVIARNSKDMMGLYALLSVSRAMPSPLRLWFKGNIAKRHSPSWFTVPHWNDGIGEAQVYWLEQSLLSPVLGNIPIPLPPP